MCGWVERFSARTDRWQRLHAVQCAQICISNRVRLTVLERQANSLSPLENAIVIVSTGLSIVIIADVILSYILDPFHPIRRFLDGIVQPLLAPIRRRLPPVGGLDFSPLVLLILLDLVSRALRGIIS